MDLNYLYHRHGVSLAMAENAACEQSSAAHRMLAAAYSKRIANLVRANREARA